MSSLTYRSTDSFEDEAYSDRGTGSKQDLSVWRPNLFNDEYRIMYVATNIRHTHGPDIPTIVVKETEDSDGKALAKPVHFEVVWTDQSTGGSRDGQIYKTVAPHGYVALSDVATHGDNSSMKPGDVFPADKIDPKFRCVHKSLVERAECGKLMWTDKGSGGKYDGAVWDISGFAGFKAGRGSGDKPDFQQYSLNHTTPDDTATDPDPGGDGVQRGQPLQSDTEKGEDQLGLTVYAKILAEYIASSDLDTPFVLGILGKWGSGKSFFFNLVMERLYDIQKMKVKNPDTSQYVGHMYYVKFDAWTYSKKDLWSSLMYRIFKDLSEQLDLEAKLSEADLTEGKFSVMELFQRLSKAEQEYFSKDIDKDTFEKLLDCKRHGERVSKPMSNVFASSMEKDNADLKEAEKNLKKYREEAQKSTNETIWKMLEKDKMSMEVLNIFERAVLDDIDKAIDSNKKTEMMRKTLDENIEDFDRCKKLWTYVSSKPLTNILLVLFIGSICIGAYFVWSEYCEEWLSKLIISVVAGASSLLASFHQYQEHLKLAAGYSKKFLTAQETIPDIEASVTNSARKDIEKEQKKILEIKKRLVMLEGESMHSVVKDRVDSEVYLSQLGIVHQAKGDLDRLGEAMHNKYLEEREVPRVEPIVPIDTSNASKPPDSPKKAKTPIMFPRGKPRIILFIDDLDRCEPENVIDVLEAMQLLVKTDLFVCLSLETRKYKHILNSSKCPTGMDFLEKIIQLPFRLPCIDGDKMVSFVAKQIVEEQIVEDEPTGSITNGEGNVKDLEDATESTSYEDPKPEVELTLEEEEEESMQMQKFSSTEANSLKEACKAFQLSPRSVKRVINVFKIMKLIWHRKGGRQKSWHRCLKRTFAPSPRDVRIRGNETRHVQII